MLQQAIKLICIFLKIHVAAETKEIIIITDEDKEKTRKD